MGIVCLLCEASIGNHSAYAGEGQHTVRHIHASTTVEADSFGAVSSPYSSLVNAAPGLLTWFNQNSVFGLPGPVTGDFGERTQVTGDWGGSRTRLAERGFFFDVYSATAYQNVGGGLKPQDAFLQNFQISANIDTGRAGLWSNGIFHFTAQALVGSSAERTNDSAGSFIPPYIGTLFPGLGLNNEIELTEYYWAQALSKNFMFIAGQIGGPYSPDRTLFGDQWFNHFASYYLNQNPLYGEFYTETPRTLYGIWSPASWLTLAFGVFDPNSHPNEYFKNFFNYVDIFGQASVSYEVAGLPGNFTLGYTWSNNPKQDLSSAAPKLRDESQFWAANISQYLYVIDDPATTAIKMKSGQALRGVGVFGRLGSANEDTTPINFHGSVALLVTGLLDARPRDVFGVGYYYNGVSDDLKELEFQSSGGSISLNGERGVEVFYNFAVTPAVSLIPSYQHIWDPFVSGLTGGKDHADVFLARTTVKW